MKASFKYQICIFTINQSNIYFEISMCESFRMLRESFFFSNFVPNSVTWVECIEQQWTIKCLGKF